MSELKCQSCNGTGWQPEKTLSKSEVLAKLDFIEREIDKLVQAELLLKRDVKPGAKGRVLIKVMQSPEGRKLYSDLQRTAVGR